MFEVGHKRVVVCTEFEGNVSNVWRDKVFVFQGGGKDVGNVWSNFMERKPVIMRRDTEIKIKTLRLGGFVGKVENKLVSVSTFETAE